ncbi:hypothetical protein [Tomitella fengzijianii]|uniref:Uncharacterized protein n=1 Tax=Tomitella fengzijianii TaxID=2597660 RepID=A0A516X0M3_9ACTN|nr:hypothetical protein [Tomitella fengzijianii]QDQ96639.1 hypothetical protein FO059_03885 [Tomitella fengzijianii]
MAAAPHQWFDSFGDLATWFGSIGTVAAFGVGFWQIHRERRHRLLREMGDRMRARRAHADHVSAWIAESELVVANRSGHPIHDVEVQAADVLDPVDAADGRGPAPTRIGIVLPGEHRQTLRHLADTPVLPAITFTDARGDRWHRAPGRPPVLVGPPEGADRHRSTGCDGDAG